MSEGIKQERTFFVKRELSLPAALLLAVMTLCFAGQVFAYSDLEMREKRSAQINDIKKTACAEETKDVRNRIEYSTALVFHNEIEEAKANLLLAKEEAKSASCKEALAKLIENL